MTWLGLRPRLNLFFFFFRVGSSSVRVDWARLAGSTQLNGQDYTRESFTLALLQEGSNYNSSNSVKWIILQKRRKDLPGSGAAGRGDYDWPTLLSPAFAFHLLLWFLLFFCFFFLSVLPAPPCSSSSPVFSSWFLLLCLRPCSSSFNVLPSSQFVLCRKHEAEIKKNKILNSHLLFYC